MLHRFRNTWLVGGGALLLVLSISGLAGAANLVSDTTTTTADTTVPTGDSPALTGFVDLNGNGIDDTCETTVTPDAVAAMAALTAADLDGNGTISVSEAAQSGWVGGANCNHGGYVSSIARTSTDTCDEADDTGATGDASAGDSEDSQGATDSTTTTVAPTTCEPASTTSTTDEAPPTPKVCPVVAPVVGSTPPAVSTVAQSDAVGGKNCNHGGAVSAAAKAAHALKADKAGKRAAHLLKHPGKGQSATH